MSLGIVFGRKIPANLTFQGGDHLIFSQIGLFLQGDVTHVSLKRKPSVLEAGAFTHCFPVRLELLFERNPSATCMFQVGDSLFLL